MKPLMTAVVQLSFSSPIVRSVWCVPGGCTGRIAEMYVSFVIGVFTQKFGFSVPGASFHVPSMIRSYAAVVLPVSSADGLLGLVVVPVPDWLEHAASSAGTDRIE